MSNPVFQTTIYDMISVNGRISKKLFAKVVLPNLEKIQKLESELAHIKEQTGWYLSLGPADRKNFGELHEKIKELEDAMRDMGHALSFACSQLESCDCDQSVGFTCGNCCLHREYDKHKELLSKINEEKK